MMKSNKITKINANTVEAGSMSARNYRGITLVALIITIIVMLILAGVSISIAINGGLFDVAKRVAKETEEAKRKEQELANGRVKVGETWYNSIEDYVNDKPSKDQEPGGGEIPPEETVTPQVGDYVLYEPDVVSSAYELLGTESGYGTYRPFTPEDQSILQEKLQWQVLKVHDDGNIDLIGTPTTSKVGLGGESGYNNGVRLLNDICKELYSKPSKGIYARSVNYEDKRNCETTANVLFQPNGYWFAMPGELGMGANTGYGLHFAGSDNLDFAVLCTDTEGRDASLHTIRPIVSLGSSSQFSLKTEGTDGTPRTLKITKY